MKESTGRVCLRCSTALSFNDVLFVSSAMVPDHPRFSRHFRENIERQRSACKSGRSVSSGRAGIVQDCTAGSARWTVLAWRRCPDVFSVKRS
jgi:hypothetical protein